MFTTRLISGIILVLLSMSLLGREESCYMPLRPLYPSSVYLSFTGLWECSGVPWLLWAM